MLANLCAMFLPLGRWPLPIFLSSNVFEKFINSDKSVLNPRTLVLNIFCTRSKKRAQKISIIFYLLIPAHLPLCAQDLIQSIHITKNKVSVTAESNFQAQYLKAPFFAEYDSDIDLTQLHYSIVTIPFVMNVMPVVWISNKTYTIDSMDKDLFYSLEDINKIFKFFFPSSQWAGKLAPKKLIDNTLRNPRVHTHICAMFSHGLDAVYTALHNADKQQTLITIWGSDVQIKRKTLWTHVKRKCNRFAQDYGFELSCVKSNFKSFFNTSKLLKLAPDIPGWWGFTTMGLGYTGLTAPILVTRNCTNLLIGASYTKEFPYPYGTHPLIDSNIAFFGIGITHHGPMQRNEKINFIKDYCAIHTLAKPFLRVCWGKNPEGGNCTKCEKCLRTIVDLLIQGETPREWGFNISIQQAIKNTKNMLTSWNKLSAGKCFFWQCLQDNVLDFAKFFKF